MSVEKPISVFLKELYASVDYIDQGPQRRLPNFAQIAREERRAVGAALESELPRVIASKRARRDR